MKRFSAQLLFMALVSVLRAGTLDSLKNKLETAADDTNKVNLLYKLSEQCPEEEVLLYAKQSYELAEKLDYKRGMANALNNLGYGYHHVGDIRRSLDCYERALKINESLDNRKGIATVLNNIGYSYEEQGDLTHAMEYYRKSLAYRAQVKDTAGTAIELNNIGVIFRTLTQPDSALHYYSRSLELCRLSGDCTSVATSLANIGHIYLMKKDTVTAMRYFNLNLHMLEALGFKRGIAYALNNIGTIYLLQKKYAEAEKYCAGSLSLSQEIGLPKYVENSSRQLSLIYAGTGQFEKAYNMHVLFKKMQDSILNSDIRESTVKSRLQYEYEKKEAVEKAEQEKKDALQAAIRNSFIAGFGLVLVLAFVILRGYRNKQKANVEISKQKEIIEEKHKEMLSSINYSRRIQRSLLPTERSIARNLERLKKN